MHTVVCAKVSLRFREEIAIACPPAALTITVARFRVERVASAAALQPDAGVGSDRIVAALRLQTLVGVHLTLVDVCGDKWR